MPVLGSDVRRRCYRLFPDNVETESQEQSEVRDGEDTTGNTGQDRIR